MELSYFKKNPETHLKHLRIAAIIFGVLFILISVVWYLVA